MSQNEGKQKQVERSKAWISQALVQLLKDYEMADITVSQICQVAGVGRQTFYRHFDDKKQVLEFELDRVFEEYMERAGKAYEENPNSEAFELEAMRTWSRNVDRTYLLLKKDADKVMMDRFDYHRALIEKRYNLFPDDSPYEREFRLGGISRVLFRWVKNGMKESPEEMAKVFRPLYRNQQ